MEQSSARKTDVSGPPGDRGDPRRWPALWVIVAAQLLVVLDANVVNIALPSAQAALDMSDADRQWVVTAYSLAFGGFLLLGGRVADLRGYKATFLVGLCGFALAPALAGLAQEPGSLLLGRAAQGLAGALFAPAGLAMLTVSFGGARERARAFGVFGAAVGTGGVAGMILGGVLTEHASWHWCLLINVPVVLLLVMPALRLLPDGRSTAATGYDIPGAVTATFGIRALVYGVSQAGEEGWGSPQTLGWAAGGVLLLGLFVWIEHRTPQPMLPLAVLRHRVRGSGHLINCLAGAALYAAYLFLTYYLQLVKDYSALQTGLAFVPMATGILVGALATGRMPVRITPRSVLSTGLILGMIGLLALGSIDVHTGYWPVLFTAQLAAGLGMGAALTTVISMTLNDVRPEDSGIASALTNATQQIGGAVGVSILNVVALASRMHRTAE